MPLYRIELLLRYPLPLRRVVALLAQGHRERSHSQATPSFSSNCITNNDTLFCNTYSGVQTFLFADRLRSSDSPFVSYIPNFSLWMIRADPLQNLELLQPSLPLFRTPANVAFKRRYCHFQLVLSLNNENNLNALKIEINTATRLSFEVLSIDFRKRLCIWVC